MPYLSSDKEVDGLCALLNADPECVEVMGGKI
jgi:hypothetical protein